MAQLQIKSFSNKEEWLEEAKDVVLKSFSEVESIGRKFTLGLSGGKTPVGLYRELSREKKLLDGSYFFLVDERNVPWSDEKSNHKLIIDSLFGNQEIAHFFWDFRTNLDKESCTQEFAGNIQRLAGKGLDLAIIGIGNDGHFASIFPGFSKWEDKEITLATTTEINEVRERYSLSPNYLLKSKKILVMLAGNGKAVLLEKLKDEKITQQDFPAKFLLQHPALEIIFCEQDI